MKKRNLGALAFAVLVTTAALAATTYTTNYNLGKPGDADDNYGETIRDDLDTIDTQMKTNADTATDHIADTTAAHAATAISTTAGSYLCTTQTTVQAFLACLDGTFNPSTSGAVLIPGAQTISGVKTFSSTPIFSAALDGILNTDGSGTISASSFAAISPLTTQGDLITYDGTDAVRLPLGAADTVLTSDGTDATWAPLSFSTISGVVDPVNGGTGVANNAAATTTRVGNFALTLTLSGITGITLPTSGTVATLSNNLGAFAATTSAQLAGNLSDETGSGVAVFATSPTLVTPLLGTPTSVTLTNATGLPISTGVSGLGTGVASFLATPSSANLATALTDETGSTLAVFSTSPVLTTPTVRSSLTLQNLTGSQPTLVMHEDPDNGTNTMTVQASPAIGTNFTLTFPDQDGDSGDVLTSDGTGTLSWAQRATAPSTGVVYSNGSVLSGSQLSATLISNLSDETGTGALVFGTAPTITLANGTGLPLTTGVTGVLPMANGGSNKNATAVNGGFVYSDADSFEITAAGTAGARLVSRGANSPVMLTASNDALNYSITATVAANALTFALKSAAGTDATATDPVYFGFRSSTATSGVYTTRSVTGSLSFTVSSGSTLGHENGVGNVVYLYAIDNAGTVELAASSLLREALSLVTTIAEGGAGAADSASVVYSTTARTTVPAILIGKIEISEATAGTWASSPTRVGILPLNDTPSSLVRGAQTNSTIGAGFLGEQKFNSPGTDTGFSTGAWRQYSTISLTPGVWDITFTGYATTTTSISNVVTAITTTSGTTVPGDELDGDNYLEYAGTSLTRIPMILAAYRVSLSATTPYYGKADITGVGTLGFRGRLSAVRVF